MVGTADGVDPGEPISRCELGEMPRARERCYLCGERIAKHAPSAELHLFAYPADMAFCMHRACFDASAWAHNYRERFLTNSYEWLSFRRAAGCFLRPDFQRAVEAFDWERALSLIVEPPHAKADVWFGDQKIPKYATRPGDGGTRQASAPSRLFAMLVLCGHRPRLLEAFSSLPPATQALSALHDDDAFAERFGLACDAPELVKVLHRLRLPRHTLEDMLAFARYGAEHPRLRKALWAGIERYELYASYALAEPGFVAWHRQLAWGRLCYLFIARPAVHWILDDVLCRAKLPINAHGDFTFTSCFLYRAAVVHTLLAAPHATDSWIAAMPKQVRYHPAGSPRGFIAETARMVKK